MSRRACLGILRRAGERGKPLPPQLEQALKLQAGTADDGALMAAANRQKQTFVAAFSANAGSRAGSTGYQEEVSPTLKGSQSGGMMPAVLCLNDQGGGVLDCSEEISGTLRAQEHGHQPAVLFECHGIDGRYRGPLPVAPTLSARAGTGGGNLPLALQEVSDHQTLYARHRVDKFQKSEAVSTESARQYKDATDIVCRTVYQETVGALTSSDRKGPTSQYVGQDKLVVDGPQLIRRLVPQECELLQGFPTGWTDLPGASDSARYKALGNSVPVPCVEYLMQGIALVLRAGR